MVFQIIALIILAWFYGCYYAKMLAQKKKGIKTDQMGVGKTGVAKRIELMLKISAIIIVIVEIISILFDWTTSFPEYIKWLGAAIGIAGVAIFTSAVLTMSDSWRAGVSETDKTKLVTNGIFSISRNPAFLGFDLVYAGILIMFFNPLLFLATAFTVSAMHLQIRRVEEPFLQATFGEAYMNYKNTVNRYIGRKIFKK